jgi:hypothetical protein
MKELLTRAENLRTDLNKLDNPFAKLAARLMSGVIGNIKMIDG